LGGIAVGDWVESQAAANPLLRAYDTEDFLVVVVVAVEEEEKVVE